MANKKKVNLSFHNPNRAEDSIPFLLEVLVEANRGKVEEMLQKEIYEGKVVGNEDSCILPSFYR